MQAVGYVKYVSHVKYLMQKQYRFIMSSKKVVNASTELDLI